MVVSLGTDHHKFDRLVGWVDDWIAARDGDVDCLVQYGSSRVPTLARGVDRMPRTEILALYSASDVVVVQGGPGSILDAREVGRIPLAVPRLPHLHEVVDGHQVAFTRAMVASGDAIMAASYEELVSALEAALADPNSVITPPRHASPQAAADKLEQAIKWEADQEPDWRRMGRRIRQLLHGPSVEP